MHSYLICATPRTGSSLLCGLLASTGVAGLPEAYFRLPDELSWASRWRILDEQGEFDYADFVRAAHEVGRTDNGVFGAKLMWGTLDEVVDKLAVVYPELAGADLDLLERAFGRTTFVYVRRDDIVAQAVSRARAEQTNQWYIGQATTPDREPRFDFGQIRYYVREIEEHNAGWENWFAKTGVRPHRVSYEELTADLIETTRGVLDFLGLELPDGHGITPRHQRQADRLNTEWISRYQAMATASDG